MWKIKNIYEADRTSSVLAHCEQCAVTLLRESCEGASHACAWGCEERQPGAKLKVLVELVGGLQKGHPDEDEIAGAVKFFEGLR